VKRKSVQTTILIVWVQCFKFDNEIIYLQHESYCARNAARKGCMLCYTLTTESAF